jgi:putative ABC transport system permease protein
MKTRLGWANLRHDPMRTLTAIAGVAFAVILLLMQLGFYTSVLHTATRIYDHLLFDVVLVSPDYLYLARAGMFPQIRLRQAASLREVQTAKPFYLGFNLWLNPQTQQRRGILLMAINPGDRVFDLPEIDTQRALLTELDGVLMDRLSRKDFGPIHTGFRTEVGDHDIRLLGLFSLGSGFSADGAILASDLTFWRLLPAYPSDQVSLGLLTLVPGADPELVAARLRKMLPPDVAVHTRDSICQFDRTHWVTRTSVGLIFGLGVLVAVVVGVAIVYQVLSSDIERRLREYATLKAMGYPPRYLNGVVLEQALILAVGGFVPGLLISAALYSITARQAYIPMQLTLSLAGGVGLLCVVMCVMSGWLALAKVRTADPADLFG